LGKSLITLSAFKRAIVRVGPFMLLQSLLAVEELRTVVNGALEKHCYYKGWLDLLLLEGVDMLC
jgi:hypothetical protein